MLTPPEGTAPHQQGSYDEGRVAVGGIAEHAAKMGNGGPAGYPDPMGPKGWEPSPADVGMMTATVAAPEPEVRRELSDLAALTGQSVSLAEDLRERLASVLLPQTPSAGNSDKARVVESPMAQAVHSVADTVDTTNRILADILERLAV